MRERGVDARDVASLTGMPPLFGGLVKTLHPKIFGAILYDRDRPEHAEQARAEGIGAIATVVVTLYPPPEIDIGGVALLRAAAKNFAHVSVLCDPGQYPGFLSALARGGPTLDERRRLAAQALEHVARYDDANAARIADREPAERIALTLPLHARLRYGENPHERAAFYAAADAVEQLAGKALSYNNILDLDATLRVLARDGGRRVRAAVVKHTVPCGVAERDDAPAAMREALDADRISAYGGIVAIDAPVTPDVARVLAPVFLEIVAAPAFEDDALELLRRKRALRIMRFEPTLPRALAAGRTLRTALGGILAQEVDPQASPEELRVVSDRAPSDSEWNDLRFAWDVVAHVKSNAIVIASDGVTVGLCAGQTNRVSAVRIAAERAGERARGAACATDGYFPFKDGLEAAIAAGCSSVIAPGGSIRDAEVIAAANAGAIALVFSNYRHFLH